MPPVRRLTDAEIEARLEQIRANNEARRAAPAPEPVTDARELPLRRVVPGDYITIPARNAYEVLRVTSSEPSGDGWHLRVVVDEAREEDVFMPGDTIATQHEAPATSPGTPVVNPSLAHPEASGTGLTLAAEPDLVRDASAVPVVGPPPAANRIPHPFQGTIDFQGIPINVENVKGSTRSGVSPEGVPWSIVMGAHYGEVANTVGADGDPVDVYVGDDARAPEVYVMQTKDLATGAFDEVKAFLGYPTQDAALAAFRAHYDRDGFLMGVQRWTVRQFHDAMVRRSTSSGRLDAPGAKT